jgi:cyclopropane fatty-acyl-phospholipid synthase-like methyltransferase
MNNLPFSPAAERNKAPILERLQAVLPAQGAALEIASGTGQHAVWFAAGLPGWRWQPTDFEAHALTAIDARVAQAGLTRVAPARRLDVLAPQWPAEGPAFNTPFDAIYCANMLHIAPWATCAALMRGAARHLTPSGVLITYGPYLEHGVPTSPGNLAFDASLQAQQPDWGLRPLADVTEQAQHAGLDLLQRHAMPSNNLLLVWAHSS